MTNRHADATVTARLLNQKGRAVVTAKSHHFVVDSPLGLGGPNEEVNPVDLLLAALAAHVLFVCERLGHEAGIPLATVAVKVTGVFDPEAASEPSKVPAFLNLVVLIHLAGPTPLEADHLVAAIPSRCLIYSTLARAVPITLETRLE